MISIASKNQLTYINLLTVIPIILQLRQHAEHDKSELLETIYRNKTPFNLKHFSLSFFIRK